VEERQGQGVPAAAQRSNVVWMGSALDEGLPGPLDPSAAAGECGLLVRERNGGGGIVGAAAGRAGRGFAL
jgi:hypothetical protein